MCMHLRLFVTALTVLSLLGPVPCPVAHFQFHRARVSLNSRRQLSATRKDHHAGVISLSPATHSPRALNHWHVLANSTARFIHACPVVVDWHNFAYSIMRSTGKPIMFCNPGKSLRMAAWLSYERAPVRLSGDVSISCG
jgi:hypothetical protein